MTVVLLPTAGRRATVRALVRRLRPRAARLSAAGALFVGRALVGLVGPAVLGHIVNLVVDGEGAGAVSGPVAVLAGAALLEGVLAWLGPMLAAQAAEPALADLREDVVDRALGVALGDVERAGTGDLVARVDGDVRKVSEAMQAALPEVVSAALTVGLTVVGLALLDVRLALAGLCAAPIQILTLRWYLPRSNPVYAAERVAAAARSQQLLETIGGAGTVRALGLGPTHRELVDLRSRRAVDLVMTTVRLQTRFFARLNLAELVGLSAILVTGFLLVENGSTSVGAVTAAALYFQRLFDPINALLFLLDEAQAAVAALARLVGVADLTVVDRPPPRGGVAGVEAAGVTFAYDEGHPVLHGIDLAVAPGETVALVGVSGAGKTTLAKLVAGVHEPDAGRVAVGGGEVVLVTQEVHVFAGTLADDLRLAAPDADDAALRAALEVVGADWVDGLVDGLATEVGDGGAILSATQAQQLALARLVLADPTVAVLDEATAEAGSAGARVLEASARRALAGRTSLVVAHRLTQAAAADRIVVLDDGRVVEAGTHQELVAAGGRYAELWQAWSATR